MLWRRERKDDGGRKEAQGRLGIVLCTITWFRLFEVFQIHFQDWLLENSMRKVRFGNSGLEKINGLLKKKTEMHKINFIPKSIYFLWPFSSFFKKNLLVYQLCCSDTTKLALFGSATCCLKASRRCHSTPSSICKRAWWSTCCFLKMSIQKWPGSLSCSHFIARKWVTWIHSISNLLNVKWCGRIDVEYLWKKHRLLNIKMWKYIKKINVSGIRDPWGMSKKSTQDTLSDVYFTHHKDCFKLWKTIRIKFCLKVYGLHWASRFWLIQLSCENISQQN